MSVDTRKRQKKLEKQRAKKKAERKELARRESGGMPTRLRAAAKAPILHCCHGDTLGENGIANVLISRELAGGSVAFVMFLVDIHCLGVKDLFFNVLPRLIYDSKIYGHLFEQGPVKHIRPEAARKLIEGAVEYARRFDLPPHADYRVGKLIFGDIAAEACAEDFVYGHNGKPYFFAGPHDSPDRCSFIIRALERACGPDGYYYTVPIDPSTEIGLVDDSTER